MIEYLKQTDFFENMPDDKIEKILPLINLVSYKKNEILYKEGDSVQYIYIVKTGKILLEQKLTENITITTRSVEAGESFGWAVFLDDGKPYLSAICNKNAEVYIIEKDAINKLMEEDNSIGYIILKHFSLILKKFLDQRTKQFLRSIKNHPDIHSLEADTVS